jgi:Fe-S-cluster containining protein
MIKPTEVKAKALRLEEENYRFRAFLKNRADDDELDAQFLSLHKELFANYDCCKCNNCCRTFYITLGDNEVTRISAFLGISESEFAAEHLTDADPEDDAPYKFKANPCEFLDGDGQCRIQDCKPNACTGFPFTDQPEKLSSLLGTLGHAEVCPVVFEIIQRLKAMYGFRSRENRRTIKQ